ncbi:MFS transporter [[Brevibacterium] frigoritolerans]|nr:MFS transporter [Peribacillus frigoritolerans]
MKKNQKLFIIYLLGVFVGAMDNGIVNPALSTIGSYFSINESWAIWSFTIFTLAYAVTVPIAGKLADDYGGKIIAFTGVTLFIIGLLLSALTTNYIVFLLGRVLQGLGGGSIIPIANAEISKMFDKGKKGKALGIVSSVYAGSLVLGPVFGALIVKYLFWKWIFYINLPILLYMWFSLLKQISFRTVPAGLHIDIKGAITLSISVITLMLSLSMGSMFILVLSLVFFVLFFLLEKKHVNPIVEFALLKTKGYTLVLMLSFLSGFMYVIPLILPLIGEKLFGLEPGNSGFLIAAMSIVGVISTLLGGTLVDKIGAKKTLYIGLLCVFASSALIFYFGDGLIKFVLFALIYGIGGGIVIGSPLKVLIIERSPKEYSNSSVSLVTLNRSIGTTMGGSFAGYLFSMSKNGAHTIFLAIALVCLLTIITLSFVNNQVSNDRSITKIS